MLCNTCIYNSFSQPDSLPLSHHPAAPYQAVCPCCRSRAERRRPDTGGARVPFIALHQRRRALPPAVRGHRAHPSRCRSAGPPPRPTLGNGSRRGPSPLPRPASRSATNSAQATCIFGPHGLVRQDGAVAFSEVSETTLLLSREYAPPPAAPARQGRARRPLALSDSNTRVAVSR